MCEPVTAGLMLGGAAASTISGAIENNQTQAAGRAYNAQVAAQNALLNAEFSAKQNEILNNQNTQNSEYNTMTADQAGAFNQLTDLANQKSGIVQNAVSAPGNAFEGANSTNYANAEANREALNAQGTASVPNAYAGTGATDSIGSRVLATLAANQAATKQAATTGETNAQAQMGALADTDQAQGQLFRNMDTGMNNIARQATNTSNTLASQERLPQEQINEQNAVNQALIAQPLFMGPTPRYSNPNTALATLLGKAGAIGMFAGAEQLGGADDLFGDGETAADATGAGEDGSGVFAPIQSLFPAQTPLQDPAAEYVPTGSSIFSASN